MSNLPIYFSTSVLSFNLLIKFNICKIIIFIHVFIFKTRDDYIVLPVYIQSLESVFGF